jgi:hypothetical protein
LIAKLILVAGNAHGNPPICGKMFYVIRVKFFLMLFFYNCILSPHGFELLTKFGLCKPIAINCATQLVCVGDCGTIFQIDQASAIVGQV